MMDAGLHPVSGLLLPSQRDGLGETMPPLSSGLSPGDEGIEAYPLAIVILARDESDVLGATLIRLRETAASNDEIHVVADHCGDRTAEVARAHGATVHIRSGRKPLGKGAALHWWLEQTHQDARKPAGVVVLDADTLVEDGALAAVRRRLSREALAVQLQVRPLLRSVTVLGRLAALSETVEQRIYDAFRSRLGWPVRLRGTGMGFKRRVLEEVAPYLRTSAEDVELTIRLTALGARVESLREAAVLDPKPTDEIGATRQRARWLRGLLEVTTSCREPILRVVALGPPGWSLLSSLMLKPRSLYFPLKLLLSVAFWILATAGSPIWRGLALAFTASSGVEALGWLAGLRYMPERGPTLLALFQLPRYTAMWVRSLSLLGIARHRWLRARPIPGDSAKTDAASAE